MSSANLRKRRCRECGSAFMGGPRAWYCPKCRQERRKEASRLHKLRKKEGQTRILGETYTCEICGQEYILRGPHQRYCPECAPCAVKEVDAAQGMAYYRANSEGINSARATRRQEAERPCLWCGKMFSGRPHKRFCSEDCEECARRYRQQKADAKRYGKPEPQSLAPGHCLNWNDVDWTMSDQEIAQLTGRKYKTVWAARKRREKSG